MKKMQYYGRKTKLYFLAGHSSLPLSVSYNEKRTNFSLFLFLHYFVLFPSISNAIKPTLKCENMLVNFLRHRAWQL